MEKSVDGKQGKKGLIYFLLALFAFCGLGLELVLAFGIEPLIFGREFNDFTDTQNILHWIFTCLIWLISAFVLLHLARKAELNIFENKSKLKPLNWILCFACLALSVTISILDWKGIKVIIEFNYNGWLKFIFQYLYYIVETVLVFLIIAFGQEAGEKWFSCKKIPYGGILAALTWGLVHALTKNDLIVGLLGFAMAILFGIVYLLANKNVRVAFPFILLMLIL